MKKLKELNLWKNKGFKYLFSLSALLIFSFLLNITYSAFVVSSKKIAANISVRGMKYIFELNAEYDEYKSNIYNDRIIKVDANSMQVFYIDLTAVNNFDSKYQIIYKYCSTFDADNNSCEYGNVLPENVNFYYSFDTEDDGIGTISSNGHRNIKLIVKNFNNKDYYYELGVNAGYTYNDLALIDNQSAGIVDTYKASGQNLKILAYVNGLPKDDGMFPETGNYTAEITCRKNDTNNPETIYNAGFARWNGSEWKITVEEIKGGSTCIADFIETDNPWPYFTYICKDAEGNDYDCTNDSSKVKKIHDPLGNWRLAFKESGTFTITSLVSVTVDIFLVGGGGGGHSGYIDIGNGSGGGGGYTTTIKSVPGTDDLITLIPNTSYEIIIGRGGLGGVGSNVSGAGGETTSFDGIYTANGSSGTSFWYNYRVGGGGIGGSGGSGGAGHGGRVGGTNGGNGTGADWTADFNVYFPGRGQQTNTCEFGEFIGECIIGGTCNCKYSIANGYPAAVLASGLYSGGGGYNGGAGGAGGGGNAASISPGNGEDGAANSGGGGGGASQANGASGKGGNGADGIIIIRNHLSS